MKIKESEKKTIKRSQIRLNPYNPKRHTDKQVEEQVKNLKRVGYLGGIVWNEQTGNLLDGHRRVKAYDIINKYDGANDYEINVEVTRLDEKAEKEQLTYMAMANTKADYQLIAEYFPDIDPVMAGLSDYDISEIEKYMPSVDDITFTDTFDDFLSEPSPEEVSGPVENVESDSFQEEPRSDSEEKKAAVKQAKQQALVRAAERYQDMNAYLTITFADAGEKEQFCELIGIPKSEMYIDGKTMTTFIA